MPEHVILCFDEAYAEYLEELPNLVPYILEGKNIICFRTFSKIYGLAGLRLGWGYSSKEIISAMYKIKAPFNVNKAALAAGIEAIEDNSWIAKAIEHNTVWTKKIKFLSNYAPGVEVDQFNSVSFGFFSYTLISIDSKVIL